MTGEPIDVLVIAGWFPSADDPGAGRFVADQVEALAMTGVARPLVVSFDAARLIGGARARRRQEAAVRSLTASGAAASPGFFPTAGVRADVAVARLTVAEGRTTAAGATHASRHRFDVLEAFGRARRGAAATARRGLVHAHVGYPDGAAAIALAEALGWPLIITEHSSTVDLTIADPEVHAAYEATLARASRVLAVSGMLAAELTSRFPDHAVKFEVVPNAVPVDDFAPSAADERVPDELLFVGHRKESKGIETLLRATAIASRARPSITLRLVGRSPDAPTEARWHSLAQDLGIGDAVRFEEAANRREVADAMRRASLFVHPSPRETFGVVAAEALASGLPVVAIDSGGVTEILGTDPAAYGALVPAGDPEALAAAIAATLGRASTFDRVEMRHSIERRYGSQYVAERLAVVYREAIAGAPPGREFVADVVAAARPPTRTIVVALDRRSAASRLARLPDDLRASLVLVTATAPRDVVLPHVGRVVEAAIDTRWGPDRAAPPATRRPGIAGRLARLAFDPGGTVRRVLGLDAGTAASLAPATRLLTALARELRRDEQVEILPVDGPDHLVVAEVIRTGAARAAAGGLGRLVDEWSRPPRDPGAAA